MHTTWIHKISAATFCALLCHACQADDPIVEPETQSPRQPLDEQTRVEMRQALIEGAMPPALEIAPPEPTRGMTRGVSKNAYLIRDSTRPEHSEPVTLRDALEELHPIYYLRRDRLKARGEDVSDMSPPGQTTLRGALDAMYTSSHRGCSLRKRHIKKRKKPRPKKPGIVIRGVK